MTPRAEARAESGYVAKIRKIPACGRYAGRYKSLEKARRNREPKSKLKSKRPVALANPACEYIHAAFYLVAEIRLARMHAAPTLAAAAYF